MVKTGLVGHEQYFWPSSAPVWYCPLNPSIFEKYTKRAFGSVTFIFDDSAHSSQKYPDNMAEWDRNTAQDGGFFLKIAIFSQFADVARPLTAPHCEVTP